MALRRDAARAVSMAAMSEPSPPEVRVEVTPRWAFRLVPGGGMDGVLRTRGGIHERLVHVEEHPAVVRVVQVAADRVLFAARAVRADAAQEAIARMRFALGVDDDLAPFHARFRHDRTLGRALRADPTIRVRRRPEPFEALAWAITEQLIEYGRAAAIQRRIVVHLGRRCSRTGLRDLPSAATVAGLAPARLAALDLSAGRALALVRVAREVARGRVHLRDPDHERGWRRLRAIPGVGAWTVEMLATAGQGRHDQVPAGDLGLRKLVGRRLSADPRAIADEEEVRSFFTPYGEWAGLAAAYLLRAGPPRPFRGLTPPARPGTRSRAPRSRSVAA